MDGNLSPSTLIVLGCRVGPSGLSAAAERRCRAAGIAWHSKRYGRVIISGGKRWDGICEADAMALPLLAQGVPTECIVREALSLNTFENAFYTSRILRHYATPAPDLLTCAAHMPRALRAFRQHHVLPQALVAEHLLDLSCTTAARRPSVVTQLGTSAAEVLQWSLGWLWAL